MADTARRERELREEALVLYSQANEMLTDADKAGRGFTPEEKEKHEKLHDAGDALVERADTMAESRSRVADTRTKLEEAGSDPDLVDDDGVDQSAQAAEKRQRYDEAFMRWLTHGETRSIRNEISSDPTYQTRAQAVGTDGAGGYLVPEGFLAEITKIRLAFGGMRQVARIVPTATGNDLPVPGNDDTGNAGALLAENTQVSEQDVVLTQIILEAFKYTSKLIRVSNEFLQDEAVGAVSFLQETLATRVERILNTHFTTGTGTAQPRGMFTAAATGKTAASATAVTYNELLDLKHSVDPAYRAGARWMMADATFKAIKQIVDGNSRPLWQPSVEFSNPPTIDGDPYVINQDAPAMTTGLDSIAYGDMSAYWIRDVRGFAVRRLDERYADYDQVGFVGFARADGDLMDASAVKVLTQL